MVLAGGGGGHKERAGGTSEWGEVEATTLQAELGRGWYAECAGEPPSKPNKNLNNFFILGILIDNCYIKQGCFV